MYPVAWYNLLDIKAALLHILPQVESETTEGAEKSNQSLAKVNDLRDRLDDLKQKYTENEINVRRATEEASTAEEHAEKAEEVGVIKLT